jgi:hypothetical protein
MPSRHVGRHANQQSFWRDGLIARRDIELARAQGFESVFEGGQQFVWVKQVLDFIAA